MLRKAHLREFAQIAGSDETEYDVRFPPVVVPQ
jgi:hypothetical protein